MIKKPAKFYLRQQRYFEATQISKAGYTMKSLLAQLPSPIRGFSASIFILKENFRLTRTDRKRFANLLSFAFLYRGCAAPGSPNLGRRAIKIHVEKADNDFRAIPAYFPFRSDVSCAFHVPRAKVSRA